MQSAGDLLAAAEVKVRKSHAGRPTPCRRTRPRQKVHRSKMQRGPRGPEAERKENEIELFATTRIQLRAAP